MTTENPFAAVDDGGDPYQLTGTPLLTESDRAEWDKMSRYTPAPTGAEQAPWWQNLVSYGITKAIDNTLPGDRRGLQGNVNPGDFAGQNGRSYRQRPPVLGQLGANLSAATGLSSGALLLIAGAAAFFLLRK